MYVISLHTHSVLEYMQWLVQCKVFVVKTPQNILFLNKEYPIKKDSQGWTLGLSSPRILPPRLDLLTEDLWTLVLSLPRIPPLTQFGTSHGWLGDFSSELTKNTPPTQTELLMEDLGTSVLSLPRVPLPLPTEIGTSHVGLGDSEGDWCVETNHCIPCVYCLILLLLTTRKGNVFCYVILGQYFTKLPFIEWQR